MNVAIAGYDVEGKASFTYWRNVIGADVTILDEKEFSAYQLPYGSRAFTGPNALKFLDEFDMVVRTAGMPPRKLKHANKVWSATNEFFSRCPAPIIGVTGTKGKGTTASLIAAILKASGKTVHLVGNIGVPALDVLPDITDTDIVVYELSSFQLWDIQKSPHVAVILMIEPDHLDVHKNMDEYVEAKANIRRFQTVDDICFYYPDNKFSLRAASPKGAEGKAIRYGTPDESAVYVREGMFYIGEKPVCTTDALQLPGDHNVGNACAAISAALTVTGVTPATIEKGIRSFHGLAHRLKFVREIDGVRLYDDSIATTPGSAIAALRAFEGPKTIILGGSDKGADYDVIVRACKEHGAQVIAIGSTGPKIAKLCKKRKVEVLEVLAKDMTTIVQAAYEKAGGQGVVILSPASASFDMFANYSDRGDQFIKAVEEL